ncbi:MAG: V-type ATP synthase subunit I [Sphaerochaetaceae bacterium]
MKRVSLILQTSQKERSLRALRKWGVVHLDEISRYDEEVEKSVQHKQQMEKSLLVLQEKATEDQKPLLKPHEFEQIHQQVTQLILQEQEVSHHLTKTQLEKEKMAPWGNFSVQDIASLSQQGYTLFIYTIAKASLAFIGEDTPYIVLGTVGKQVVLALINEELDAELGAQRVVWGNLSLSELQHSIQEDERLLQSIQNELKALAAYVDNYRHYIQVAQQQIRFQSVASFMETEEEVCWIQGYIPFDEVSDFKALAKKEQWAWALDDPSEDETPPSKIRNKKWVSIIEPVFSILGTVPGYREYDISMWFLLFFALFFAMILGDAAYGTIFLVTAALVHKKLGKANNAVILLYVLSVSSIIWGSVTGTWFGSQTIVASVPFLKALVIPQIANYPELFGLSSQAAQNMVMKFCFIVGTLQLSLACVMNIYTKIGKRDLSAVADFGWLVMIDALYFLVLLLVIGEAAPMKAVAMVVGVGFLLVIGFGAQGPGISFAKGLSNGAANIFSTFLDSISAFSNIISYIRLFAVGMASLAIAQSFNSMASGMLKGFALPAGILILVIGHGLNLVMALLSVVVHGVRLNLLEFSGQLGMEWTGIKYEPFKETVETVS